MLFDMRATKQYQKVLYTDHEIFYPMQALGWSNNLVPYT